MISLAALAVVSIMILTSIPQSEASTDPVTIHLDVGPDETLTIMEDTVLSEGENIVKGKLIIPDGVTLTVQSGSDLILEGGSCVMTVDGTLVVIEGELGISMRGGSELIVNGSMEMRSIGIWRQALVIERDSRSQLIVNGQGRNLYNSMYLEHQR